MEAIQFNLPSGEEVQIIPNAPDQPTLFFTDDGFVLKIEQTTTGYSIGFEIGLPKKSEPKEVDHKFSFVDVDMSNVQKADIDTENNILSALRTCINCKGRRYCIKNGCANTPCGWICG